MGYIPPKIVDIHPEDAFYWKKEKLLNKAIYGITALRIKEDGWIYLRCTMKSRKLHFYRVKLSYIPEKFLK